jgi:hypothetical protein
MRISKQIKEDIAIKAAAAMIAKKRHAVYEELREKFTKIAERQFVNVPTKTLMKCGEFIRSKLLS